MSASGKYIFISFMTAVLFLPSIGQATTGADGKPLQHTILTIENRDNIKVVYEAKDNNWDAGVGKALYYVRGLVESYKSLGVTPDKLHISIVLHGPTVYWLLNEDAYQKHENDPFSYNPNEKIVHDLLTLGVSIEACNTTMKARGWSGNDLLPGVIVVHDAYTRLIDLQHLHYAYIRF